MAIISENPEEEKEIREKLGLSGKKSLLILILLFGALLVWIYLV